MSAATVQCTSPAGPSRLLAWAVGLALAVGVLWRVGRYLLQFPFWGDEAFVLLNLLDRDYLELTGPLGYAQVAPLLFLWVEETALNVLGTSELSLRLVPVLASVAALFVFWRLTRLVLPPFTAALAVAVLAVSYYPVRHGCEVKPYAFDLLASVLMLYLAARWLREPARLRWLVALALTVPVALLLSYPAVFTAGAVGLLLMPTAWRQGGRATACYALFGVLMVLTFMGHYGLVGRQQIATEQVRETHDFMQDYWRDAFPPASLLAWPGWALDIHTGNLFAYPMGGPRGGSTATFVLALLGIVALRRQRTLLAMCLLPFGVTLVAAALHKYPYGGSARVAQHLAPAVIVLMAAGLARVLAACRVARPRDALNVALLLSLYGVVGFVRDCRRPYKDIQDYEARRLAAELWARVPAGEEVMVCNCRHDVPANLAYYLRSHEARLRWLGKDRMADAGRQAWLLFLDSKEHSANWILNLLGEQRAGWDLAACERDYLPPGQLYYPEYHCARLRLVRTSTVVARRP